MIDSPSDNPLRPAGSRVYYHCGVLASVAQVVGAADSEDCDTKMHNIGHNAAAGELPATLEWDEGDIAELPDSGP